jgi:hypothetical protein
LTAPSDDSPLGRVVTALRCAAVGASPAPARHGDQWLHDPGGVAGVGVTEDRAGGDDSHGDAGGAGGGDRAGSLLGPARGALVRGAGQRDEVRGDRVVGQHPGQLQLRLDVHTTLNTYAHVSEDIEMRAVAQCKALAAARGSGCPLTRRAGCGRDRRERADRGGLVESACGRCDPTVRVLQRVLALTAATWHNWRTGQPIMRSLVTYDH